MAWATCVTLTARWRLRDALNTGNALVCLLKLVVDAGYT
jgi:hypothetical protein